MTKRARFHEGPAGTAEFEDWMEEQPEAFQEEWETNTEEYGDQFKKSANFSARDWKMVPAPKPLGLPIYTLLGHQFLAVDKYGAQTTVKMNFAITSDPNGSWRLEYFDAGVWVALNRVEFATPKEAAGFLAKYLGDPSKHRWNGLGGTARYAAGRDPFWMNAKFPGKDKNGVPFKKGDRVFYYPATKTILTGDAAEKAALQFQGAVDDEAMYNWRG